MRNFNKDRNKRNSSFNKRDSGRNFNRDSQRPTMHSAVCDACKKTCEVPFKPVGNKPIYCSSCFSKQGGSRENRFNKPRFERGGSRENRFNKPRFENRDNNKSSQSHEEILKGIKALNYKLDELFKFLPTTTPTKKPKAKVKKKVVKKKVVKKKVVKKKVAKKK